MSLGKEKHRGLISGPPVSRKQTEEEGPAELKRSELFSQLKRD